jgi:hypothetical protein
VVVGADSLVVSLGSILELQRPVGYDFICVHVERRACACLEYVQWKLAIKPSIEHFRGRVGYQFACLRVQCTQLHIRLGCGSFDGSHRVDHLGRESQFAYGEVLDGALGLYPPVDFVRNRFLPKGIALDTHG